MRRLWKKLNARLKYSYQAALAVLLVFFALVMGPFLQNEENSDYLLPAALMVFFIVAVAFLALRTPERDDGMRKEIDRLKGKMAGELTAELAEIPDLVLALMFDLAKGKRKAPVLRESILGELRRRGLAAENRTLSSGPLFMLAERNSDPRNNGLMLCLSQKFLLKRFIGAGYTEEKNPADELVRIDEIVSVTADRIEDFSTFFKEDALEIIYIADGEEKTILFSPFRLDEWIDALRKTGREVADKRTLSGGGPRR